MLIRLHEEPVRMRQIASILIDVNDCASIRSDRFASISSHNIDEFKMPRFPAIDIWGYNRSPTILSFAFDRLRSIISDVIDLSDNYRSQKSSLSILSINRTLSYKIDGDRGYDKKGAMSFCPSLETVVNSAAECATLAFHFWLVQFYSSDVFSTRSV